MNLEIEFYQDWMKEQVSELFSMQYHVDKNDFAKLIDNFYDHPYQKNKCLRIVARDGDKIVGFQSFFYWPYTYKEFNYHSYQSGNSLVHPEYRGKGIFQKLLQFADDRKEDIGIDFLMGFPVEDSKNSFIRNKWNNILNLEWFVKIANPFSFLFKYDPEKIQKALLNNFHYYQSPTESITLSNSNEFINWRVLYSQHQPYLYHEYSENKKNICFQLKLSVRKKIIRELVIGNVQSNSNDIEFITSAIHDLAKRIRKSKRITIISIAINENSVNNIKEAILKRGFTKTKKSIYFIIKPLKNQSPDLINPKLWSLYRSDIDTW